MYFLIKRLAECYGLLQPKGIVLLDKQIIKFRILKEEYERSNRSSVSNSVIFDNLKKS